MTFFKELSTLIEKECSQLATLCAPSNGVRTVLVSSAPQEVARTLHRLEVWWSQCDVGWVTLE
jgi:hypothetical protein